MILSKKQIIDAEDIVTRTVHVPEWDGDVIIKTMTGLERDSFESTLVETKNGEAKTSLENIRAKLLSRCLVDESGKRIFTDKDIRDLGEKSARALDRLYNVARELNGIGADEEEALLKNSSSEVKDISTSASLAN